MDRLGSSQACEVCWPQGGQGPEKRDKGTRRRSDGIGPGSTPEAKIAVRQGLTGKELRLSVIWTSSQFCLPFLGYKFKAAPVQGEDMSDLSALAQNNWCAPASLVIQLAFLIAGVWFARNILRTMRASQEQLGAMLKLSITGVTGERHLSSGSAKQSLTEVSPYWLAPSTDGRSEPIESGPRRIAVGRKMALWLQAPMSSSEAALWRRIITWLQAPAGS
jgi:hypothetical protein